MCSFSSARCTELLTSQICFTHQDLADTSRSSCSLLDHKTKQPLLRAEALKVVERLQEHIVKELHQRWVASIPACAWHQRPGWLPQAYENHGRCVYSPEVADSMLLELNYGWHFQQSIKKRRLDPSIDGFYDQHSIEAVQVCVAYSRTFAKTTERFR